MNPLRKRAFRVGAFVLGGTLIAVVTLVWLGSTRLFVARNTYVTYIDGSVQGLNVDSDVKFRGVKVGRVSGIHVAPDDRLIEVEMELDRGFDIAPNLRATLDHTGITGMQYVDLGALEPGDEDRQPTLSFQPPHPLIPSRPGNMEKIEASLVNVRDKLLAIDTGAISSRTVDFMSEGAKAAATVDSLLRTPALTGWTISMRAAADRADTLLHVLQARSDDARIDSTLTDLAAGARDFRRLMHHLDGDMGEVRFAPRADSLFGSLEDLVAMSRDVLGRSQYATVQALTETNRTMTELRGTIEQFNSLMLSVETYPGGVLFTRPPPEEE